MRPRVYLDWNATAPLRREARDAMVAAMDVVGNPSSVHGEGRAARALVERSRAQVGAAFGAAPERIVFTSGATEAAATVLGAGWACVHASAIEHDCIWAHRDRLPWGGLALRDGQVVLPETGAGDGDLFVRQAANSETGVLQDIVEAPPAGAMVCDAVQLAGKVAFSADWLAPQFFLLSAHKFGGPKGVGALIVPDGVAMAALVPGGGQEMGRRSGTENVIGIAGMGAAAQAAMRDLANGAWDRVRALRDKLEARIASGAPDTIFVGNEQSRLPNTSMMVSPGWKGETQVMAMDLAGFAVSAGSACSSGKVREARVLGALGLDHPGDGLRVSMGPTTSEADVEAFAAAWLKARQKLRARAA